MTKMIWKQRHLVPRKRSSKDDIEFWWKRCILRTSLVKGIQKVVFGSFFIFWFRPFGRATLSDMKNCIKPVLNDNILDVIVLQIGSNDMSNKQSLIKIEANEIWEIR